MARNLTERMGPVETMALQVRKPAADVLLQLSGLRESVVAGDVVRMEPVSTRPVSTGWLVTKGVWSASERTAFHQLLGKLLAGLPSSWPGELLEDGTEPEDVDLS